MHRNGKVDHTNNKRLQRARKRAERVGKDSGHEEDRRSARAAKIEVHPLSNRDLQTYLGVPKTRT